MKKVQQVIFTLAIFVCALCVTTTATAAPGWRYKTSHGMTDCEFSNPLTPGASINGGVVSVGHQAVTIAGQAGSTVRLTLICRRPQAFDNQGELSYIGPEVSYSGPGTPKIFGVERPGDFTSEVELPKGREWTVAVGTSPATYTLTGGSDSIAVTVQPITAPVTMPEIQGYVAPVAKRANQAYEAADHSWKRRVFQMTAEFNLAVNSIGRTSTVPTAASTTADPSMGWGLNLHILFGGSETVKGFGGVHYTHLVRQVGVMNAFNAAPNGFNSFGARNTHHIAPKVGLDVMPVEFFSFQVWGAIGPMILQDAPAPLSQTADKSLYIGQANTAVGMAGVLGVNANFFLLKHLMLSTGVRTGTTFNEIPSALGNQHDCGTTVSTSCISLPQGRQVDVITFFGVGVNL
jgi:hypothetical protein